MKKIMILAACIILSLAAQAQDASEIIRKADELMQGKSSYAEISMMIHRPKWERSLKMKSWSKGSEYALIYITEPAKEKGQVFLKREREMWNWLPSINRTIKIPPSMMMQSWMGSDLTNDDLVNQSSIVNDYSHSILGKETLDGYECYKIELIPDEDAPVVWGKIHTWVSVKELYFLKTEYFDEDGFLVSTETMSNIRNVGDRNIPTKFTVIPEDEKDHFTVMEFESIRFNLPIEDGFFSIQNMKNIR
ncbi:MAG: outer membrane lipoprotein-sorting protein [Bacteroidales bacterium]|nr:outer membrane lipoprotein-sorting protein [Bacteroidales bacterium]